MDLTTEQLLDAYRTMRTIRGFEQTLNELSQAERAAALNRLIREVAAG